MPESNLTVVAAGLVVVVAAAGLVVVATAGLVVVVWRLPGTNVAPYFVHHFPFVLLRGASGV